MTIERRRFCGGAVALAAGAGITASRLRPKYSVSYKRRSSKVAVLKAENYSGRLDELLLDALGRFDLDLRGKSVLLKPNLVEDLAGPVNTHPALVGAAATSFLRLGAARVMVGEGPGHQRDTELVTSSTGLDQTLEERGIEFVDLNRDELIKVKTKATFSGLVELWLPRTALVSDFIVSMPKVKTHHWAGVTLSVKNMFGIVPGMKYGWPKNLLHWHGIHESILDICATVPVHFVIADGIVAMEGNGPLQGTPRVLGKIVLSDDPIAADATCARLMGLEPSRVPHLALGSEFLGNLNRNQIRFLAGTDQPPGPTFAVLPEFLHLVETKLEKDFRHA